MKHVDRPATIDHRLARLDFFRRTLGKCLDHACERGGGADTLRSERKALGIEDPMLDVVALWSVRRPGDEIEIPELDRLLEELVAQAEAVAHAVGGERANASLSALAVTRRRVTRCAGADAPSIPRRELEALCRSRGLVDRFETSCRMLLEADGVPTASEHC